MNLSIAHEFSKAFQEAGGQAAVSYCDLIRFIAVMFIILAVMWSLHHFLSSEAKESEGFMERFGSRVVRLSIGLTLFIIFLTTRGT
jgi:flagellar biogenesis protein FliO